MVVYMYMHNRGSGCYSRLGQAQRTDSEAEGITIVCYVPLSYFDWK